MKRDKLWWRAFKFNFGGIVMFDCFTLLPSIVGFIEVVWSAPSKDFVTFIAVCVPVCICLALQSAWNAVERATQYEVGIRRKRELIMIVKQGRGMMLYGNPVGWLAWLVYFFLWKKALVPLNRWFKGLFCIVRPDEEWIE